LCNVYTFTSSRKILPEKFIAERLNGYSAIGCVDLVGSYDSTGQIIPGFA